MGTAIIDSHLGGGKYRVRLQFDNALVQLRIDAIDARLAEITARLTELATEKAAAKTKLDADVLALNVYIDATPPQEYSTNTQEIDRLTAALYESKSAYDLIVINENRENLQKTALEKDKNYLSNYCPAELTADVWCVQLVTTLSGTIKTIECDYGIERDTVTDLMKFDTGIWLPYGASSPDSKSQHPMATSQHANWFNLSMLPAAQRDKARYRVATLLDVATGRIQFDGQYNTEEHTTRYFNKSPIFPVVTGAQREFYDGAELYYPCGMAGLYVNGDRVIVDLHDGVGVPTVIGFYSNPRECVPDVIWPINLTLPGEMVYSNFVGSGFAEFGTTIVCSEVNIYDEHQSYSTLQVRRIVGGGMGGGMPGFTVVSLPEFLSSTALFPGGSQDGIYTVTDGWIAYHRTFLSLESSGVVSFDEATTFIMTDTICTGLPIGGSPPLFSFGPYQLPVPTASVSPSGTIVLRHTASGQTRSYTASYFHFNSAIDFYAVFA